MGELTASMVRMETVKAHDEDYFMQLDQRISRDLDVDLSETIMRLSRVSTAYQAVMQVGAPTAQHFSFELFVNLILNIWHDET